MTNNTSYNQDNMSVVSSKSFSQLVTQSTRHMRRVDWQPKEHTQADNNILYLFVVDATLNRNRPTVVGYSGAVATQASAGSS